MAVNLTIQQLRKTAAQWTTDDTVLAAGLLGFETDTGKYKIGDGTTAWTALSYPAFSSVPTWGSITGTLSSQTDLQNALDLKANLAGAAFTDAVSVTTSGSGDTLQLTNSGSGTTLNILNSGSGDFFKIDTDKVVVSNNGNVAFDTNTLFVDAVNNRVGFNIAPLTNLHLKNNAASVDTVFRIQSNNRTVNLNLINAPNIFEVEAAITRFNAQGAYPLYIANEGVSVGFASTPSARLHVQTAATATIGAIIQAAAGQTANLMEINSNGGSGGDLFRVEDDGSLAVDTNTLFVDAVNNRVGVGTSSPLYKLDVSETLTSGTSNNVFNVGYTHSNYENGGIIFQQYYNSKRLSLYSPISAGSIDFSGNTFSINTQNVGAISMTSGRGVAITNQLSPTTVGSVLKVTCATTDSVGAIIQAAAGQTANLQEWRNSAGTVLSRITSSGTIFLGLTFLSSSTLRMGNNNVTLDTQVSNPLVTIRKTGGMTTNNLLVFSDSANATISYFANNGAYSPVSLADGDAANGTVYYSTTASKLVYKDSGGVVNDLY